MDLVIDIGNTLQKAAVFSENSELVRLFKERDPDISFFEDIFSDFRIESVIISNVGTLNPSVSKWICAHARTLFFSQECRLPISLKYETPGTLGTDRIAAAVGANHLFPNRNVLSIMAGTCLVADFVNADGEYLGGSISPGLDMRFKALHNYTANLPLLQPKNIDFITGNSTEKSILSGVVNGIVLEIKGIIEEYSNLYPNLEVIISGGNSKVLQNYLKKSIFAAQNPVLVGLHKILRLNASEI